MKIYMFFIETKLRKRALEIFDKLAGVLRILGKKMMLARDPAPTILATVYVLIWGLCIPKMCRHDANSEIV